MNADEVERQVCMLLLGKQLPLGVQAREHRRQVPQKIHRATEYVLFADGGLQCLQGVPCVLRRACPSRGNYLTKRPLPDSNGHRIAAQDDAWRPSIHVLEGQFRHRSFSRVVGKACAGQVNFVVIPVLDTGASDLRAHGDVETFGDNPRIAVQVHQLRDVLAQAVPGKEERASGEHRKIHNCRQAPHLVRPAAAMLPVWAEPYCNPGGVCETILFQALDFRNLQLQISFPDARLLLPLGFRLQAPSISGGRPNLWSPVAAQPEAVLIRRLSNRKRPIHGTHCRCHLRHVRCLLRDCNWLGSSVSR
mmetsp:Transcript_101779/g.292041  ORF Transcript_101779/g.292041 Transcript_101779/m.292041 type:complete len:305 (+) Transcript_101779:542-1456(+)